MILKNLLYKVFISNCIIKLINQPFVNIFFPPIIGLYYGCLDIWGSEWDIIANYKDIHKAVFISFMTLSVLTLFLKGISQQYKNKNEDEYKNVLESLLRFVSILVKKKRDRFFNHAENITKKGDVFKRITQPKVQIENIIDGCIEFICTSFDVGKENIEITIMQKEDKPIEPNWFYSFKSDNQKKFTKAKTLLNQNSTAKYCHNNGEALFIPDIRKGEKEGYFCHSERSKKAGHGSIYCRPIKISNQDFEDNFIFTIAIWGKFLCTPYDQSEADATKRILDEIGDRVELELFLFSIREFRYSTP